MKRTFCIFAAVMLIAMSGCGKKKDAVTVPVTEGINCTFSAAYNGTELQGKLKIAENMHTVVQIEKPESLNGMKIEIDGENISLSYLGMTAGFKLSESPQTAAANLMVTALKSAAESAGVKTKETADGYALSGNCKMGDYCVMLDKQLRPTGIEMKSAGFSARFSEFG